MSDDLDVLVIGGGPAGLTTAIYLARYRWAFEVVDAGHSRCAWIPTSHNHPGFPDGIDGKVLVERMREQAERFGARILKAEVAGLRRDGDTFLATCADGTERRARFVLLATGVIDLEPGLPDLYDSVRKGLVRYCPICDGFEVRGDHVAVIGHGEHGVCETEFIRDYAEDLTLLTLGEALAQNHQRRLAARGIRHDTRRVVCVDVVADRLETFRMEGGELLAFDTVYSALGTAPRSDLARQLGADMAEDGRVRVDPHQETSMPNLFAAGDVVPGLNQITIAQAQAAIAATAIHNRLRKDRR